MEAVALGVDVGGTKIRAGAVDRGGRVRRRVEHPTPLESESALLSSLDQAVEEVLAEDVVALGFGIPSTIDQRSGRVVSSVNIPLADVDLRGRMTERFGLPVAIDNDGNVAAIAEWAFGAGRGTSHLVMLTLGTGIGGGLVLDGRPYRGAVGAGAELGHIVVEHDGPPCQGTCTGRGHLEAVASGTAADAVAARLLGAGATAHDLVALGRAGDVRAAGALADLGRRLGSGIGTLVNVLEPEVVVIGGGFAAAGELVLGPARDVVAREALPPGRDLVRIVPGELGGDAGIVGAAVVALDARDAAAAAAGAA